MKKIPLLSAVLLAVTAAACTSTALFQYPAQNIALVKVSDTPVLNKTVAVEPFIENFGARNDRGAYALFLVPLAPYGYLINDNPCTASTFSTLKAFQCNPTQDFADAAIYSLRRSNLFAKVIPGNANKDKHADYILTGDIRSLKFESRVWSYGLSVGGLPLWLIGIPMFSSHGTLTLDLALLDKDRQTVWQQNFNLRDCEIQGLYYNHGTDTDMYAALLAMIMNRAIPDIQRVIQSK